jgi:hypothetical protein
MDGSVPLRGPRDHLTWVADGHTVRPLARFPAVQLRTERVVIETDRLEITGTVTLPQEGYRSRLSDFLSSAERDFIAVQDAVIVRIGDPTSVVERPFVAVARRHIVLAAPLDPGGEGGEGGEGEV